MKKLFMITVVVLATQNGKAQIQPNKASKTFEGTTLKDSVQLKIKHECKNSIQINVLPLIFQSYNLFYERELSKHVSFGLAYGHSKWSSISLYDNNSSIQNTITLECKYYISDEPMQGFFVAPYIKYFNLFTPDVYESYRDYTYLYYTNSTPGFYQDETNHRLGLGCTFGFKKVFKSGFTISQFIGGGEYFTSYTSANDQSHVTNHNSNIDFRLGVNVGYSF